MCGEAHSGTHVTESKRFERRRCSMPDNASSPSAEGAPYYSRGPLRPAVKERVGSECRRYSPLFRGFLPTAGGCNPQNIRGYLRHPHPLASIPWVETHGYQGGAPSALFFLCAAWLLYEPHFDIPPLFRGFQSTAEGYNPLDIRGYLRHPSSSRNDPGVRTPGYQGGAPSALGPLANSIFPHLHTPCGAPPSPTSRNILLTCPRRLSRTGIKGYFLSSFAPLKLFFVKNALTLALYWRKYTIFAKTI